MPIFEYRCPDDHVTEHLHLGPADAAPATVPCERPGECRAIGADDNGPHVACPPVCGKPAGRTISATRVGGWSPKAGALDSWVKGGRT